MLKHIETKEDYTQYCATVQEFLDRNRVKPGCFSPVNPDGENYFSWHPCGCCNRPLGGTREDYSFATLSGETFEESICVDCVYFLTYGALDDQTMLNLGLPVDS